MFYLEYSLLCLSQQGLPISCSVSPATKCSLHLPQPATSSSAGFLPLTYLDCGEGRPQLALEHRPHVEGPQIETRYRPAYLASHSDQLSIDFAVNFCLRHVVPQERLTYFIIRSKIQTPVFPPSSPVRGTLCHPVAAVHHVRVHGRELGHNQGSEQIYGELKAMSEA